MLNLLTCYDKLWQDTNNKKILFLENKIQSLSIHILLLYKCIPVPGFQMVGSKITHKKQTQNEKKGKKMT